jgi:hypothetical protein
MPSPQPGVTPESIQQITERLDTANDHLASIAGSLGKVASMLDRYRPQIDRAARLAGGPVGKIMTMGGKPGRR